MEHFCLTTWKQIQRDNNAHPFNAIIYKNGDNYCTYYKSAMQMACCFNEHPFILEHYCIEDLNFLLKITFTAEAFECIKKNYRVVSLPTNQWLAYTHRFVSDYEYHIWSGIISLELKMRQKKEYEAHKTEENQYIQKDKFSYNKFIIPL